LFSPAYINNGGELLQAKRRASWRAACVSLRLAQTSGLEIASTLERIGRPGLIAPRVVPELTSSGLWFAIVKNFGCGSVWHLSGRRQNCEPAAQRALDRNRRRSIRFNRHLPFADEAA